MEMKLKWIKCEIKYSVYKLNVQKVSKCNQKTLQIHFWGIIDEGYFLPSIKYAQTKATRLLEIISFFHTLFSSVFLISLSSF